MSIFIPIISTNKEQIKIFMRIGLEGDVAGHARSINEKEVLENEYETCQSKHQMYGTAV